MMLWSAIGALTALAVLVLVWPLAKARPRDDRLARDLAVYRDQLSELDLEVERGTLRAEERDAARIEIERRMLRAAEAAETTAASGGLRAGLLGIGVALLLPLVAVPIYLRLGMPEMPDRPLAERQDVLEQRQALARFEDMAERLASRLKTTPDDLQGWKLLGRTYAVLERHGESVEAYRRAAALDPTDGTLLSLLGEALVYEANGEVTPEAVQAFDRALLVEPMDSAARFYRALAFAQAGDSKGAYDGWLALAKDAPADAPWRDMLMANLEDAAKRLGRDLARDLPAPPAGPSAAQVEAVSRMSADERNAMILGMVERLAERMKETPGDLDGWMRLGQAYGVLGRKDDAVLAYRQARALTGEKTVQYQQINEALRSLGAD
jgi:cytochrome c-type biogenesis protein CcmH